MRNGTKRPEDVVKNVKTKERMYTCNLLSLAAVLCLSRVVFLWYVCNPKPVLNARGEMLEGHRRDHLIHSFGLCCLEGLVSTP